MKDKIFGVLQRIGRSFMLPIALLPVSGLFLGIGSSLTNITTLETYGLINAMGPGTISYSIFSVLSAAGTVIFDNLPLLFAVGVAIGMAKKEKAVAALAGIVAFFIMHATISSMITVFGEPALSGSTASVLGIHSLQMGVFGGIIVGLGVSYLHNRFYNIELPQVLSFFGGTRFVPIISAVAFLFVGVISYFLWPIVQSWIYSLGNLVMQSGYFGTWIYGVLERALIPFGLHHVFYLPFWQTAMGGTQVVGGQLIEGAQNIFFAELAQPGIEHFSVSATRFMSGKFPLMIFGLPGAAFAMYRCSKPENRKQVGGLLLSAALTAMLTGITEPLEFTFLFVAPLLYVIHCIFAGLAYMFMHILNVGVGMTFSGGLIDLTLFGILQGNSKTSWLWIPVVGVAYALVYYFIFTFLIRKFNYATPGRDENEIKLYTRSDYNKKNNKGVNPDTAGVKSQLSEMIVQGLGGSKNISDVDCCATRLRITVFDSKIVDKPLLQQTGASGVIINGQGVQVIYGPKVTIIKSDLEDFLTAISNGEVNESQEINLNHVNSVVGKESPVKQRREKELILVSPINGKVITLKEVNDGVFSEGMVGDGIAFEPYEGKVYAPCNCEIMSVADTKHAINMVAENGAELLLHIGIDTNKLDGKPFDIKVSAADKVSAGDLIAEFDINAITDSGCRIITPMLITNSDEYNEIKTLSDGTVSVGDIILSIQ